MAPGTPRGEKNVRHVRDLEIARRALAGDPRAIDRFVARMKCVRRFLTHLNARFGAPLERHELEDTIQNTLTAVWRKLDQYGGHGALEAWVYRFSYLELMSRLRALDRRPRLLDDLDDGGEEPRTEPEPDPLENEHLYRVLDRLGPPGADVIRLKHLEQLTFVEISRRLGISDNTVKTRYYRAMRKLRGLLAPEPDERQTESVRLVLELSGESGLRVADLLMRLDRPVVAEEEHPDGSVSTPTVVIPDRSDGQLGIAVSVQVS